MDVQQLIDFIAKSNDTVTIQQPGHKFERVSLKLAILVSCYTPDELRGALEYMEKRPEVLIVTRRWSKDRRQV